MEERLQALNANIIITEYHKQLFRIELTGLNPSFFHRAFSFAFTKYQKEITMEALIIIGGIALVGITFVVAYSIYKKEFWDRQDFMDKINRMF